jgi:hypothetical protein|tara:strand:+ start:32325 stop:32720 length:396 start_codon:yes stop_codon:yes gene_type:complete
MIALRVSFFDVAVPVLLISITLLVLVIIFRKLRARWAIGHPDSEKYAVLYSFEKQPISGEIEIFYETEHAKEIEIWLLDENMNDKLKIDSRMAKVGGNKINFDSKSVANGRHFYELRSDNQKTSKAIFIEN